jgi:hypothetical protein
LLSSGDVAENTSEAEKPCNMDESPLRAGGEKGCLRAKLDAKSGGHVGEGLPTTGPSTPLMAMEMPPSSPPPGSSPSPGLARR